MWSARCEFFGELLPLSGYSVSKSDSLYNALEDVEADVVFGRVCEADRCRNCVERREGKLVEGTDCARELSG